MVSSSTKDRGEALCESLYRSTNGCCMWLGNIPDGGKRFYCKNCDLANGVVLMYAFARFQVVSRKAADC